MRSLLAWPLSPSTMRPSQPCESLSSSHDPLPPPPPLALALSLTLWSPLSAAITSIHSPPPSPQHPKGLQRVQMPGLCLPWGAACLFLQRGPAHLQLDRDLRS